MLDTGRGVPPGRMPWSAGEGHGPPANPELPQGGPIWNRPLQGLRRGGGMWFPSCPPARPSAVGADSISARVTLRRRGVARDDASIVPYRGCNNAGFEISRVAANPPLAVGADSISARGTLRRRGFSGAVAAFSQICRAGVHARRAMAISKWKRSNRRGARRDEASRPTAARVVTANPFGRNVYHGSQGRATVLPQILRRPPAGRFFQHFEPPAGRRSTLSKL